MNKIKENLKMNKYKKMTVFLILNILVMFEFEVLSCIFNS